LRFRRGNSDHPSGQNPTLPKGLDSEATLNRKVLGVKVLFRPFRPLGIYSFNEFEPPGRSLGFAIEGEKQLSRNGGAKMVIMGYDFFHSIEQP
jgi:hypothetical protein